MNITQKSIGKIFTDVKTFNEVAGSLNNVTKESIALQLDLLQEEYLETVEAFDTNNPIDFADGVADCLVIILGMVQKLEAAGYDMDEVLYRICVNNLSKYIPVGEAVHFNPEYNKELNEKHQVYVLKNARGKIMKPSDFVSVDLLDCVPESFFGEQV
jgi:hypothetical protein